MNVEASDLASVGELTKWGRVKFGSRKIPAMRIAIPVGIVIALGLAFLARLADTVGTHVVLGVTIFTAALSAPCIALVYALVVDRSTMLGAPDSAFATCS